MKYSVSALPKVNRVKKKLHVALQKAINDEVEKIAENPYIGEPKKGDLAGVWVHKFKHYGLLYLIGYLIDDQAKIVTLVGIGPHENFYRDLKRYLRS
jgi:mRNA interferase RelE/StbE